MEAIASLFSETIPFGSLSFQKKTASRKKKRKISSPKKYSVVKSPMACKIMARTVRRF